MAARTKIHAVILNWNEPEKTSRCIRSIQEQDEYVTLIIVDNGSHDASFARIREAHPGVVMLRNDRNLGFAAGANAGISRALKERADLIWLLNNDAVAQPSALASMIEASRDPAVGIVGSVMHPSEPATSIEAWGGGYVRQALAITTRATTRPKKPLDYITGGSMLLKADMLRETGAFDDTFFLYLEDVDLCLRAVGAGWKLAVADGSHVLHEGGGSARSDGRRPAWIDRHHAFSSGAFISKHGGRARVLGAAVRLLGMVVVRAGRLQIPRLPRLIAEFLRGYHVGRSRNLGGDTAVPWLSGE